MTPDNMRLRAFLTLMSIPSVGQTRMRSLIDAFGSPTNVLNADPKALVRLPNISETLARQIATERDPRWVDKQLKLMDSLGVQVVSLWDDGYPARLRTIYDPPPLLFIRGDVARCDDFSIAIVGTRKATHYGRQIAQMLSGELVLRGITVVSGLARGIDTIAHKSALANGGPTVAVLGCGLDVVYPPENRKLYQEVESNGAIMSEFAMGTRPDPGNFPSRNRIISGMSQGVVVVEAGERSGALLTANLAVDQGREVFAVPGNINNPMSQGPNNLIKIGAKIVTDIDDIINELRHVPQSFAQRQKLEQRETPPLSEAETHIYKALSTEPKHIDVLSEELDKTSAELLGHLLQMELKGAVLQLPGKLFVVA